MGHQNGTPHRTTQQLQATEEADVKILSMLMQDALLPVHGFEFNEKEGLMAVLALRYRWEDNSTETRVYAGLSFSPITHVEYKGFDQKVHKTHMLNLLMMDASQKGQVRLVCSGDAEIVLHHNQPYTIHFADLSEAWPSINRPHHLSSKT